ncbi:uncharacterized protein V6R79_017804 [Siganus canaliculatus]
MEPERHTGKHLPHLVVRFLAHLVVRFLPHLVVRFLAHLVVRFCCGGTELELFRDAALFTGWKSCSSLFKQRQKVCFSFYGVISI